MALIAMGLAGTAHAQQYPERTVTIVAPYPAGGYADVLARLLGKSLTEKWHQSIVVENRGGATGMIGAEHVARAAPDGYTLLMGSTAELALNAAIYDKIAYNPERDLEPVILLSVSPLVLVVNPAVPATNLAEFIALARSRPGEVTYASPGDGSPQHVAAEWMQAIAKVKLNHIPFRGGAPQLVSIVGGQVQSGFASLPNAITFIKSGKLRALAVIGKKRAPLIPAVPTMSEQGFDGIEVSQWRGIVAPAATPKSIVSALNASFGEALRTKAVLDSLASVGEEPLGNSPEEFGKFIHEENAKYRREAKTLGIHLN